MTRLNALIIVVLLVSLATSTALANPFFTVKNVTDSWLSVKVTSGDESNFGAVCDENWLASGKTWYVEDNGSNACGSEILGIEVTGHEGGQGSPALGPSKYFEENRGKALTCLRLSQNGVPECFKWLL